MTGYFKEYAIAIACATAKRATVLYAIWHTCPRLLLVKLKWLTFWRSLLAIVALSSSALSLDLGKSMTQYAHRIWGQEEGLFQPTVYSVLQTRDGFLWLGTQDSLIRFDGVHFREFAEGDSVLHGSLIRSLVQDRKGNLWAGSLGNGIFRISQSGAVKQFSTKDGLPSNSVFCLALDRNGALWACTTEGLVRIDRTAMKTFTHIDGLLSGRVRAACQAQDGNLWIAGLDSGLSQWTGSRFVGFSSSRVGARTRISSLACSSDGTLWAGTSSGLLHIAGKASRFFTSADGLPDNEVSALAEGHDGVLWIGTSDGISRLHNGEMSTYRTRDGLSHSQVLALCVDREGSLWAGTKNGLDQFTDGKVTPYTTNEGLLSNDAGPVLEDRTGHLWIGTLGRGLNSFDGHRFRSLTSRDGLLSDIVLSLALDPSDDLWVGTNAGLNRVKNGQVIAAYRLPGSKVQSLSIDSQGTLWAGTSAGLGRFESGRFLPSSRTGKADRDAVIALSGDGRMPLFASFESSGLYLLRDRHPAPYPVQTTQPVDCFFYNQSRRSLWMGTLGSGLLRWKDNAISHVYVKDGLYDNRIYSMIEDDKANLWLASSKGIFRLNEAELEAFAEGRRKTVTSVPFTTGQLHFECRAGVQPAACRTRDGRLWFSTTSGLVVVDPNRLARNQVPPPVSITALIVNGNRLQPASTPHLPPRDMNNIEIRYAGLSFISPEKVTFRYRLEEYDRTWVEAGERRVAFYSNLPPGNFHFRVEARNTDGLWSAEPASLAFIVEPKLYQHWWFFALLALVSIFCVFSGFRIRVRRLNRRFQLVLAERNRIARELHDTLLQGLSGITMQLQALWARLPPSREREFLSDIIRDAGTCSVEARQSLWGLRNSASDESSFSDKLAKLARDAIVGKDVSLSLAVEQVSLAGQPDAEYQLLRIGHEAISNSLKHAAARRLTVRLYMEAGTLHLSIDDDGFGFAQTSTWTHGHFGLRGMQERAQEIGAELSVAAFPGKGVSVHLCLPVPKAAEVEGNRQLLGAHQI